MKRAKQSFLQSHETLIKSLEGRSTEMLMERMSGADSRFMSIPEEDIEVGDRREGSGALLFICAVRSVFSSLMYSLASSPTNPSYLCASYYGGPQCIGPNSVDSKNIEIYRFLCMP